jgi:hypothetical protein
MQSEGILVSESLAETLWRLEEVRQGFRPKSTAQVQEALKWVLSRQGLKGAYGGLFAATENDRRGVKLLTGERIESAALRHILGEEALRTALVWNLKLSPAVKKATEGFNKLLDIGTEPCARETGFFCCHKCAPAFLRTLAVVKPDNWGTTLDKGIKRIKKERLPDGKWHGFPFYYTLLTLSEIDTPTAKAELKHASKTAKSLINRYQKEDRISRFRKLALQATFTA